MKRKIKKNLKRICTVVSLSLASIILLVSIFISMLGPVIAPIKTTCKSVDNLEYNIKSFDSVFVEEEIENITFLFDKFSDLHWLNVCEKLLTYSLNDTLNRSDNLLVLPKSPIYNYDYSEYALKNKLTCSYDILWRDNHELVDRGEAAFSNLDIMLLHDKMKVPNANISIIRSGKLDGALIMNNNIDYDMKVIIKLKYPKTECN